MLCFIVDTWFSDWLTPCPARCYGSLRCVLKRRNNNNSEMKKIVFLALRGYRGIFCKQGSHLRHVAGSGTPPGSQLPRGGRVHWLFLPGSCCVYFETALLEVQGETCRNCCGVHANEKEHWCSTFCWWLMGVEAVVSRSCGCSGGLTPTLSVPSLLYPCVGCLYPPPSQGWYGNGKYWTSLCQGL